MFSHEGSLVLINQAFNFFIDHVNNRFSRFYTEYTNECAYLFYTLDGPKEYCLRTNSESFQAQCLKNEVIVMTSAIYGRMRIGRCLEAEGKHMLAAMGHDPLFLGCSVDVLHVLDARCSGKNKCEIRVSDDELEKENPCHAALKSYLEVEYACQVGKTVH